MRGAKPTKSVRMKWTTGIQWTVKCRLKASRNGNHERNPGGHGGRNRTNSVLAIPDLQIKTRPGKFLSAGFSAFPAPYPIFPASDDARHVRCEKESGMKCRPSYYASETGEVWRNQAVCGCGHGFAIARPFCASGI